MSAMIFSQWLLNNLECAKMLIKWFHKHCMVKLWHEQELIELDFSKAKIKHRHVNAHIFTWVEQNFNEEIFQ